MLCNSSQMYGADDVSLGSKDISSCILSRRVIDFNTTTVTDSVKFPSELSTSYANRWVIFLRLVNYHKLIFPTTISGDNVCFSWRLSGGGLVTLTVLSDLVGSHSDRCIPYNTTLSQNPIFPSNDKSGLVNVKWWGPYFHLTNYDKTSHYAKTYVSNRVHVTITSIGIYHQINSVHMFCSTKLGILYNN